MACANFQKVAGRIDSYTNEIIELQQKLVSIQAISPKSGGTGEKEKTDFLTAYLKDLNLGTVEEIQVPDPDSPVGYRPTLVCRIPGQNTARTVWLMAHTDVVPAGDLSKWNTNPFELKVEGDKMIGRGTEDNHQGLVASLMAARAFKEEGITPQYNIALLFVADEEMGSYFGIGPILKERPDFFGKDDIIVVPDGGTPDGTQVEVAEKSMCWTKFRVLGKQCHASMPGNGINAMKAGAKLVTLLDDLYNIFSDQDPVFAPPISTFEPTKKEANVPNINTIPGEDIFYLDCRILPHYKLSDVEAAIRKIAERVERENGVTVEISFTQREQAAPATDVNAPVVKGLQAAIKEVYGVDATPQGIGGGTVAAHIRRLGFSAAVWSKIDETMHGPNEYSLISNTKGDAKVFAHLICGCGMK